MFLVKKHSFLELSIRCPVSFLDFSENLPLVASKGKHNSNTLLTNYPTL